MLYCMLDKRTVFLISSYVSEKIHFKDYPGIICALRLYMVHNGFIFFCLSGGIVKIPSNLIPGFHESTQPVVVYRNRDGSFKSGFVMRQDEAVVSLSLLRETRKLAGIDDYRKR